MENKFDSNEKLLRIGVVGKLIGRTPLTIKHWYAWVDTLSEDKKPPVKLPTMYRIGVRKDRYFKESDIVMLEKFRDYLLLNPGVMSYYNLGRRGERGIIAKERREFRQYFENIE